MTVIRHSFCVALILASGTAQVLGQAPPPAKPGTTPAAPGVPAAPAAPAGALNIQQETEALMNAALGLFQEGKYQEALAKIADVEKKVSGKPYQNVALAKNSAPGSAEIPSMMAGESMMMMSGDEVQ